MGITRQDREEWFHHPVTQEFLQGLREDRQNVMETWAQKGFVGDTPAMSAQLNVAALGGMDVLTQVIEQIMEHKAVEGERA